MVGVDTPRWRVKHERSVLKGDPRDTTEWSGHHRGSADGSMKEEAIFSLLGKYEEYVKTRTMVYRDSCHMKTCKHGYGSALTMK